MSFRSGTAMKLPMLCFLVLCLHLLPHAATGFNRSLRTLKFEAPNLYPESFDWDRVHDRFLIGSNSYGTLSELANDGSVKEFLRDEDYAGKAGIAGVKVDSRRNRVIVTVTDSGGWSWGGVAAYDLDTKERVYFVRLDDVGVAAGSNGSSSILIFIFESWVSKTLNFLVLGFLSATA